MKPTESMNSRTVRLLLERYGYYFYVIKRIPDTMCPCKNLITDTADESCKRCLGTGQNILIYKVYGSIREAKQRETNIAGDVPSTPKIIYIKGLYRFDKDDIVIDDEDLYHVMTVSHHKGEHGEFAFTRLTTPQSKSSNAPIIKNLKELIDEYKLQKKKR